MSDDPKLPEAVIAISHVPMSGHARGDMITDPAIIAAIYEHGQQRSIVPVSKEHADAHAPKED